MDNSLLLELKNISKTFPGVLALDNVHLKVGYGEVHALMGENGAGKSTLMKVLTGIYRKDSGQIIFDGNEMNFCSSMEAQLAGISTIYQEINLIPYLSVAENIFLGREPKKSGRIDWNKINQEAHDIIDGMGISLDVKKPLNSYSTAIQQMVAIARAISVKAKLVVMDEPTSSLDEKEVNVLFKQIKKLKKQNISVIFISHRLDEIFEICDRTTILKDGKLVGDFNVADITKVELVSMMIGRDATNIMEQAHGVFEGNDETAVLKAADIKDTVKLRGVTLDVKKGEILGLAGLLGSGRTEFAKTVFGDNANYEGTIEINGKPVKLKLPKDAISKGFAFCSEDRKVEGNFPNMSIRENMTIAILPKISRMGIVDKKKQAEIVDNYINSLAIKTPSPEQKIKNLSGGNQQKVLLARWLCLDPDLVILDEPTRGIDVGAKAEIEELIQKMSKKNISILMISSELEELVRNCHRVVVMRDGKNVGELKGEDLSEKNILAVIAQGGDTGTFQAAERRMPNE